MPLLMVISIVLAPSGKAETLAGPVVPNRKINTVSTASKLIDRTSPLRCGGATAPFPRVVRAKPKDTLPLLALLSAPTGPKLFGRGEKLSMNRVSAGLSLINCTAVSVAGVGLGRSSSAAAGF